MLTSILAFFIKMRWNTMFITAVCVIFLIKLQWPKSKSLYNHIVTLGVNKIPRLSYKERKIKRDRPCIHFWIEELFIEAVKFN